MQCQTKSAGKNIFKDETKASILLDETISWRKIKHLVDDFPNENDEVLCGIKWGSYAQLYTPAFWKLQYLLSEHSNRVNAHRLSSTILEEIVMCILGGFGIPSEMGIIAFDRLKANGNIKIGIEFENIYQDLSSPFLLTNGKKIHYRFYNQKSKYIHNFLNRKDLIDIPVNNDLHLRDWLLTVNGIGLKTASWITRNWLKSDKVAILDIHLLRAGRLAGFFKIDNKHSFDYLTLEKQYLEFCSALNVEPSNMDAIIWLYMKNNTKLAIRTLFD
ncbi:MAG: 8-oxoguanine DNA glycosylase [Ginsengibacter sp.]